MTITHAWLAITIFGEVKCNQVAGACLIQCIHNAAMRFSISWAGFLETQALPFSRIQWVLTDFFTGESYSCFGRVFHHRNATKLQICKSKVAIVSMRHGRTNLVEVGVFLAGCTWEEHEHHKTFMSKICQLNLPETISSPLNMNGWKMKFIQISFQARPMFRSELLVSGNEKLQNFSIWSFNRYSIFSKLTSPFERWLKVIRCTWMPHHVRTCACSLRTVPWYGSFVGKS